MKKILLSLFTLLVALGSNAQVTFDFDNNYATYFPELPGVSSGTGDSYVADGELKSDAVINVDGVTITIKASSSEDATPNRIWASSPRLRMYNQSFTIAAAGHKVTKIAFNAGSNFNISTTSGTLADKEWFGSEESVVFAVAKNTQIKSITVTVDGEAETPSAPVDITNTPETAYTTSQAYELIAAGKGLDKEVYVKGTITKIDEISTEYGNATYYITDGKQEFEIYRGYGLGGEKFTSTDDLQDGDEIIVCGKLVDFKGTYEMTTGSKIYSLNGKTAEAVDPTPGTDPTPEYTVVGKGTLAEPYTTEDIIKGVYNAEKTTEGVWVKGTILGCFGSEKEPISAKDPVESNIAIGNADGTNVIPVQLVASNGNISVPRQDLNIVAHPELVGKEVWVYGDVVKYFSVAGIKNTSNYSLDGTDTGIQGVNYTPATRNAVYNMSGVKVTNTEAIKRGVYIVDGQKKYVK